MKEVVKALRKETKGCVDRSRRSRGRFIVVRRSERIPSPQQHFFPFRSSTPRPQTSPLTAPPLSPHLNEPQNRLCVIAGDISPIDVISHIPILCEEAGVPYVYVHSKDELGAAGQTKRPTSCMLVLPEAQKGGEKMSGDDAKEFKDMYGKVVAKIGSLD